LRNSGEDPRAKAAVYETGPHRYHAIVVRGDGMVEDPSVKLGMVVRDPIGYHARLMDNFGADCIETDSDHPFGGEGPAIVVGADVAPNVQAVTFDIFPAGPGRGYHGVLRIPMQGGSAIFAKTSEAPTVNDAKAKGVNLALETAKALTQPAANSKLTATSQLAVKALNSDLGKAALNAVVPGSGAALTAASKVLNTSAGKAAAGAAKAVGKKLKFW
jgi:hypothetical protein